MATSYLSHTGMVCSLVAGGDSLGYFIKCAHEQDQICPLLASLPAYQPELGGRNSSESMTSTSVGLDCRPVAW